MADPYAHIDPRIDQEADQIIQQKVKEGKLHSLHPLHRTWVCWFRNAVSKASKVESVAKPLVARIDSVEKFWIIFSGIERINMHYWYLMNNATSPKWEDPLNANGCRWIFETKDFGLAQTVFRDIAVATLGECLMKEDKEMSTVNGIELQASPPKVKIWMSTVTEELELADDISRILKDHGCGKPLRSANQTSTTRVANKVRDDFILVQNKKRGPAAAPNRGVPPPSINGGISGGINRNIRGGINRSINGSISGAVRGGISGSINGSISGAVRGGINRAARGRGITSGITRSITGRSAWNAF